VTFFPPHSSAVANRPGSGVLGGNTPGSLVGLMGIGPSTRGEAAGPPFPRRHPGVTAARQWWVAKMYPLHHCRVPSLNSSAGWECP